jgi:hypothetical protein
MLRNFLIAFTAILTCVGFALIVNGVPVPGWQAFIFGAILLLGTLFERWRYRRIGALPKGNWQKTDEKFFDPSSGVPVEVVFDPNTGERRYVRKDTGAN